MKTFRKFLWCLAFGLWCFAGQAATIYVRDGGSGSGTSWSDAYDQLTSAETAASRGDTIYVADGSYNEVTFNTATSGTSTITVKKATVSDHGTSTGWSDAYGDGVADVGKLVFDSAYWVFDGVFGGGPGNWGSTNAFGFRIHETLYPIINTTDNITIRHTELWGKDSSTQPLDAGNNDGFECYDDGVLVEYVWIHGCGRCPIKGRVGTGSIFQYVWFDEYMTTTTDTHGEVAADEYGPAGTYRWNLFTSIRSTGGLMINNADDPTTHIYIYGNVFWRPSGNTWEGGNGLIGGWTGGNGEEMHNVHVWNNTFIDTDQGGYALSGAPNVRSGNDAKNNLFYSVSNSLGSSAVWSTTTHNHFINSALFGTSTSTGTSNPFVNYTGKDFRLTANTTAGTDLGSPYNVDMLGNTRTTWTRGAVEYTSGAADTNGPVITSVSTTSTNDVGAVIGWTTDESSTSIVLWGLNASVTNGASTNASYTTSHSVTLSGLSSSTVYYSRVISTDASGNSTSSNNPAVFTTYSTDSLAPTNILTAPTNGETISGTYSVTDTATDNVGVVGVKFYYDTTLLLDDTASPYSYSWDTLAVANGSHTVWSVARDARTNLTYSATNTITVTNDTSATTLYWPMNEGTGATTADSGGTTNVLILTNGAAWVSGKYSGGIALDGVNDFLYAPNSPRLTINSNKLTVACWLRLTNNNAEWFQIVGKTTANPGDYSEPYWCWHLFAQTNSATAWSPAFQLRNDAVAQQMVQTPTPLAYNTWIHLAATYDGTNMVLYTNGVAAATDVQSGNILDYADDTYVGASIAPSEFAKGAIDELRLYSTALTAGQVLTLYQTDPTPATGTRSYITNLRIGR